MNRKRFLMRALIGFLILLMAVPAGTIAQNTGESAQSSGTSTTFTQEELDQMLAPIALYPDSLLAQILVAATFPDEVVEADQWVKQNENLKGDRLNAALDKMNWDLSVKALVPFPKVLSMMSDKREWTQRLGDAFLAQQNVVMDTVQSLRAKARAQGNLKSTREQKVVVKGESIEIEPVNPRVVYVPAYNPTVVYGSWWYPAYPPYAYNPYYPGYVYDPYYTVPGFITAGVLGFAAGIAVGSAWNWGWGHWDWHHRDIQVNNIRNININRNDTRLRHVRTTNLNRAVNQRRIGATGRAGVRTSGKQGPGARPSATSVQRGLKQRQGKAQVRQGRRNVPQGRQPAVRSGQKQRVRSPGKATIGPSRGDGSKVSRGGGKAFRGAPGRAAPRGGGKAIRGGGKASHGGAGRAGSAGRSGGAGRGGGGQHRR